MFVQHLWWHIFNKPLINWCVYLMAFYSVYLAVFGLYISIPGSIWSVHLVTFIQYNWQYMVCISDDIYSVFLVVWQDLFIIPDSIWSIYHIAFTQYTWQYLFCISDGIYSASLAVFGISIWWHLLSIPGSIWSVYLMAFIQQG